jgi:4-amino-4-deoxy-L-arabinose transferase-like glycosyltransferase
MHVVALVLGLAISIAVVLGIMVAIARSGSRWRHQAAWFVGIMVSFVLAFTTAEIANGPDWFFLVVEVPLMAIVVIFTITIAIAVGRERRASAG